MGALDLNDLKGIEAGALGALALPVGEFLAVRVRIRRALAARASQGGSSRALLLHLLRRSPRAARLQPFHA